MHPSCRRRRAAAAYASVVHAVSDSLVGNPEQRRISHGPLPARRPEGRDQRREPGRHRRLRVRRVRPPGAREARRAVPQDGLRRRSRRHRTKAITLYRQGDINYLLNAEPGSHAAGFVEAHGPCAPAMAWRVVDARARAEARGRARRRPSTPGRASRSTCRRWSASAARCSTSSRPTATGARCYAAEFDWLGEADPKPEGRRLLLPRPPDPQRGPRQHGHLVSLLSRHLQLPRDPLLRHRGQADRPAPAAR